MDNNESWINPSGVAYSIKIKTDLSSFTFEPHELFKSELAKTQRLADGRTLGEAARDNIHKKLDEFIDKCLGV